MKKVFYVFSCVLIGVFCMFMLSACDYNVAGKSAYEIAVENGFEGTVSEWLDSLKGDAGEDGSNGQNGRDGEDGRNLSVSDLFDKAVVFGLYLDTSAGYEEFLSDYFSNTFDQKLDTAEEVANKAILSAVSIYCEDDENKMQAGAGVFYYINRDADLAYIITNYHVVSCYSEQEGYYISNIIYVYLYGQETLTNYGVFDYGESAIAAEYIGGSAYYDLAILKVEGEEAFSIIDDSYAKAVTFANSDLVSINEIAVAVGNPIGAGLSVSTGRVSRDSEDVSIIIAGGLSSLRCLRIDTPVNPGNSGGGLFDKNANLLGIVNAKKSNYIDSNGNLVVYDNIAFALQANVVKNVAKNVVDFYEANFNQSNEDNTVGVHRCIIGTITGENSRLVNNEIKNTNVIEEDVIVVTVTEDGIAQTLGFEEDDRFVSLTIKDNLGNETTYNITRTFILIDAMLTLREGYEATFVVERDGENLTLSSFVVTSESFVVE